MSTEVVESQPAPIDAPEANVTPAPTYVDRWNKVKTAGGPAYEKLALSGDLDEAEKLLPKIETDVKADPSPADDEPATPSEEGAVETAPAPGTGTKPQESKGKRTQWSELREAKAKAEAERDLLKQQLMEMRNSSPAKEVPPPAEVRSLPANKPKRPKLVDYESIDKYEADMEAYEVAKEEALHAAFKSHIEQERSREQGEVIEKTWEQQVAEESKTVKDYQSVAFSPKTPASDMMIVKMKAHKMGAKIAYHLGMNPDIAARLAEATNIPNFDRIDPKDPQQQRMLGRAEALVEAEFDRIAATLTKPDPTPQGKPLPRLPKPSGELHIEPRGSAVEDELTAILKMTDGDQKSRAYKQFRNRERAREMGSIQ